MGGTSGAVSVAAHALGGGGMAPSESAVVLLILACASVGAVVTSIDTRRSPALLLALMLAAGQAIGHATLTIASDHQHGLLLSLPMLAAHIAAVGVCAVLIRGAERGYVVAASTVAAIVAVLLRPWAPEPRRSLRVHDTAPKLFCVNFSPQAWALAAHRYSCNSPSLSSHAREYVRHFAVRLY